MNDNLGMTKEEALKRKDALIRKDALKRLSKIIARSENISDIIEKFQIKALKSEKECKDILSQVNAKDENDECDTYGNIYESIEKQREYLTYYRKIAELQEESKALGAEVQKIVQQFKIKEEEISRVSDAEKKELWGEQYYIIQAEYKDSKLKDDTYEEYYDDIKTSEMASNILSSSAKIVNDFTGKLEKIEVNGSFELLPSVSEIDVALNALRKQAAAFKKDSMYKGTEKNINKISFFRPFLRKKKEDSGIKKVLIVGDKEYVFKKKNKRKWLYKVADAIMEYKFNRAEEKVSKEKLEPSVDLENNMKYAQDDMDYAKMYDAILNEIYGVKDDGYEVEDVLGADLQDDLESQLNNETITTSNTMDEKDSENNSSFETKEEPSLDDDHYNVMTDARFKEIEQRMIDEKTLDGPLTFGINDAGKFDEELYNREYEQAFKHNIAFALPTLVQRGKISPFENVQFIEYVMAKYKDARKNKFTSNFDENVSDYANVEVSDRAKEILENALNNPEIRNETKEIARRKMDEMIAENNPEIKDETKENVENNPEIKDETKENVEKESLENSSSDSLNSEKTDSGDKYYNELSDSRDRYDELKRQKNQMFNEWKKGKLDEYFEKSVKPLLASREDYEANMKASGLTESYDEYVARARASVDMLEAELVDSTEFKLPEEFERKLRLAKDFMNIDNRILENKENERRKERKKQDEIRRKNAINEINQRGIESQKIASARKDAEKHYEGRDEKMMDTYTDEELLSLYDEKIKAQKIARVRDAIKEQDDSVDVYNDFTDEELLSKYDEFVEAGIIEAIDVIGEKVQAKSR